MMPAVHIRSAAAIILAAGKSERFGSAKLLQPFQGKSLLMHAVEAVNGIVTGPVIVVTGGWQEEMGRILEGSGVTVIYNEAFGEGMASSIRKGIGALATAGENTDGAFILVGDQPFVDTALMQRMLSRQEVSRLPMVACHYNEILGTPVLFHKMMFPRLMELKGDKGARSILQEDPDRVATVLFPDGATDIDTPGDYERLLNADR